MLAAQRSAGESGWGLEAWQRSVVHVRVHGALRPGSAAHVRVDGALRPGSAADVRVDGAFRPGSAAQHT